MFFTKINNIVILSLGLTISLLSAGCGDKDGSNEYIPPETSVVDKQFNFHIVDRGVWRSSQPNRESILRMREHGLRSIMNLRGDSAANSMEKSLSDSLGLNYFNYPMDATKIQDSSYLAEILEIVSDSVNQPILIHCLGGKDRTGLIVGLYKKEIMGVPIEEIRKEMIMYGHDAEDYPKIIEALKNF